MAGTPTMTRSSAATVLAFLERGEPSPHGTAWPIVHRHVAALAVHGRPWLVLAAREAASLALPVWEARHADVPEPRRAIAALDAWLACPCAACAGSCYAYADPLGRPEDRHFTETILVAPDRPATDAELDALDGISCAALTPSTEHVESTVIGALELAARALAPTDPASARVRERVWEAMIELARIDAGARPTRRMGPSPVARIRQIESDAVRPAFDEIVRSRALKERLRAVRQAAMRPIGGRAEALFTQLHGEEPRLLSHEARGDGWPEDGRLLGSTLVVEATESFSRAAHPLAGVLLLSVAYDLRGATIQPLTRAAYYRVSARTLEVIERPLLDITSGAVRGPDVSNHVLDALTLFDQFGAP